MVTCPLHDVAAFTITRDKPLSCANLLAKQVVYPRLYPPQIFHLLLCLPGDIFPGIRPYFSKELRPFIDLQAFILTRTSLNACAHLSCVTFEGRKPYERQRGYSAWYNSVWYISLQSQYEWERNEAIARKGYVTNDLKVDTFHPHYLAAIQACLKSPKSNKKGTSDAIPWCWVQS